MRLSCALENGDESRETRDKSWFEYFTLIGLNNRIEYRWNWNDNLVVERLLLDRKRIDLSQIFSDDRS